MAENATHNLHNLLTLRGALVRDPRVWSLIQTENPATEAAADLTLTLTKPQLLGLLAGRGLDGIGQTGDPAALGKLIGLLDTPDPAFPIVTP